MLQTRIVPSKPALILEGEKKNLIITDIHIGFENSMASNEIFIGKNSTINETISEISEIIDSENPELKLKHIVKIEDCYAVTVYEGSLEEYTTFIHPEASFWLEKYFEQRKVDGEHLDSNSPVFRKSYQLGIQKVLPITEELILHSIWYVIKKAGLRNGQEKKSGRYETQTNHGFRKRWVTIMENTDGMKIILAEKMTGHSVKSIPMADIYNLPTIEVLFKEYKKAIPELTIDDSLRKQIELDKISKEKEALEQTHVARDQVQEMISNTVKQEIQKMLLTQS